MKRERERESPCGVAVLRFYSHVNGNVVGVIFVGDSLHLVVGRV